MLGVSADRILLTGLLAGGGVLLFIALLNRRLIIVRDSRLKGPVLLVVLLLFMGGAIWIAQWLPMAVQIGIVAFLYLGLLGGEVRRVMLRRRYAGSPPMDTVLHDVPLHRPLTTTDLVIHRYQILLPEWKGPPFRIVHLSDFHANAWIEESFYRETVARAGAIGADLAFYTGDYVTRCEAIPLLERFLRPIGRVGDFAVLGNHDHWTDPDRIAQVLRDKGIRVLRGESIETDLDGHTVEIWGCDYAGYCAWTIPPPIRAEPGVKLALCHTPDAIRALVSRGASAVFSGHNHAGQARIPLLGPIIVPSRFGRLFDHGHFVIEGTHLFVSSGVGAATPPVRLYCQPDLFLVEIRGEGEN
jgi:hypothetical protein